MLFSSFLAEARQAATLYHLANVVLSIAFLIIRGIPQLCEMILVPEEDGECTVTSREREILLFLAVIILVKGRKTTNWRHYVNNIFLFSKIANIFLFLRVDVIAGIVYLFLMIVVTVLVPEPAYSGPEKVTYFNNTELFDTLTTDRRTTWVIQFYTTWSSECRHSSPVFSQLSEKFTLPNLKFGKLDVSRWAKEGERFRVNSHPSSRQLPTVCVFKDAKEVLRRPVVNENRRAVPFVFNEVDTLKFAIQYIRQLTIILEQSTPPNNRHQRNHVFMQEDQGEENAPNLYVVSWRKTQLSYGEVHQDPTRGPIVYQKGVWNPPFA